MAVRPEHPAPYAPPTTMLEVITRYRNHGLMTPFTADVMLRAGVPDSLVNRTLQALRTLDLIDEAGEPTPALRGIADAPEAEYQARLADALRAAYDEVFQYIDPKTATDTQIRDAFRSYQPRGQHGRMVTLFTGLCQAAGIMDEPPSRPAASPTASRRKPATPIRRRKHEDGGGTRPQIPPALSALLESLPGEGESWTETRRDDFVHAFGVLLDLFYPVADAAQKENEEE